MAKIESVLEHIQEGCGVRQTGRLCHVDRATVSRSSLRVGTHAHGVHDDRVDLSPLTTELQFDAAWAFVGKKEANRDRTDESDDHKGDYWDHVVLDPEHRLVVSVLPGARTVENTEALEADFHRRTSGRLMNLMTSDAYSAYRGRSCGPMAARSRRPGPVSRAVPARASVPRRRLRYAVVEKTRCQGRVVKVACRVVFGSERSVRRALAESSASRSINTAFIDRQNGTDRHRKTRKVRKPYRFSKDSRHHEAATYFSLCSDNFCRLGRTPRERGESGNWQSRTPAMAAGPTDHVWSISEWIKYPIMQ